MITHRKFLVLPVGALLMGALVSIPPANATCASAFGIGNTASCTSNLTSVAIAIGTNAVAHADGVFGIALSTGTQAYAATQDAFTFATAIGDNAAALAVGLFRMATQLGPNGEAFAQGTAGPGNFGLNFALNVSLGTTALTGSLVHAVGIGNLAVNLFGNGTTFVGHRVVADGTGGVAINLGGVDDIVVAGQGGNLKLAFNNFGSHNHVQVGPGPVAIAGSILQSGAITTKQGPGFNINGFRVGCAAATSWGRISNQRLPERVTQSRTRFCPRHRNRVCPDF
jgi:hypothetical protein